MISIRDSVLELFGHHLDALTPPPPPPVDPGPWWEDDGQNPWVEKWVAWEYGFTYRDGIPFGYKRRAHSHSGHPSAFKIRHRAKDTSDYGKISVPLPLMPPEAWAAHERFLKKAVSIAKGLRTKRNRKENK